MKRKNLRLYYPLLLGLYAVVGLVSVNIDQMVFSAGLRSIVVSLVFVLFTYWLFSRLVRNEHKAALLCAWFFLFFFGYGHVFDALQGLKLFGEVVGRHRFIFPLWLVLFGAGTWLIVAKTRQPLLLGRILNIASIVLLAMPIIHISSYEIYRHRSLAQVKSQAASTTVGDPSRLPDIYYIILDGYPRQDMLLKYRQVDNSAFLSQLESQGFFIPPCSMSNYAMTNLSLASSLNMDYVKALAADGNQVNYVKAIHNSKVRQFLQSRGYQVVSISSGIWFTDLHDADHYIDQQHSIAGSFLDFRHPSEFEVLYIRTSILRLAQESESAWFSSIFQNPRKEAYDKILFQFDQLDHVADTLPSPKFVFVHIIAPHTGPFVFDAEGKFMVSTDVGPALEYVNKRTIQAVQDIISQSSTPPIIIIQGDHGMDTEARNANLIALRFPGVDHWPPESDTITPVNIFRYVLDTYFDQHLPFLPDKAYYSTYDESYQFTQVTYPCSKVP